LSSDSFTRIAEAEVFTAFAELTQDRIALLISHRFSKVRTAGRIVVLSEGSVSEGGTHDETGGEKRNLREAVRAKG